MGKLKSFYKNNRIYVILMGIGIFCLLLVVAAFVYYFIEQTRSDVYGDRLKGLENVAISNEHKEEIISFVKENKTVDKATINIKGKIIYINIYLNDGKVEDAQGIAIKSLEKLTEEEKEVYDINFTFDKTDSKEDTTFPMMGYKKSDATIISWTKVNGES